MRQGYGQTLPNPDDTRPIVRRPTDLPGAAGYDSLCANPESLMAQLALQYSALNHCATRVKTFLIKLLNEIILYLNHNVFKNALVCYEK